MKYIIYQQEYEMFVVMELKLNRKFEKVGEILMISESIEEVGNYLKEKEREE